MVEGFQRLLGTKTRAAAMPDHLHARSLGREVCVRRCRTREDERRRETDGDGADDPRRKAPPTVPFEQ
jgi:hypothetical protein